MELREPIDKINYWLERDYGVAFDGKPNFRVVFADDQFEKRWTTHNEFGFELLRLEVKLLPKYKQDKDFAGKFILERYIPIIGETDLTTQVGYEPCWVFRNSKGEYLPPWMDGCSFIIESLYEASGRTGHAKYKDPDATEEERLAKIKLMEDELFGNETPTGDALAHKYGVTVPEMPIASSEKLENNEKVN